MAKRKRQGKCVNREDYIHCEVEAAVVNIREGLRDSKGRDVTSIELIPEGHLVGESIWKQCQKFVTYELFNLKREDEIDAKN